LRGSSADRCRCRRRDRHYASALHNLGNASGAFHLSVPFDYRCAMPARSGADAACKTGDANCGRNQGCARRRRNGSGGVGSPKLRGQGMRHASGGCRAALRWLVRTRTRLAWHAHTGAMRGRGARGGLEKVSDDARRPAGAASQQPGGAGGSRDRRGTDLQK